MPPPSLPAKFNSLTRSAPNAVLDLPGYSNAMVSMNHVIETGIFAVSSPLDQLTRLREPDLRINLDSHDAYTAALKKIADESQEKLRRNIVISDLLKKDEWSKDDRVLWEKALSETVLREMRSIPGLADYRTSDPPPRYNQPYNVRREPLLNQLSIDIGRPGAQPLLEFDCEHMSATAGLVIQFIENTFLSRGENPKPLKAAHDYYYTTLHSHHLASDLVEGHALLASAATGNFIEATNRAVDRFWPGYKEINTPGYSFAEFVRTGTAVLANSIVLSSSKDRAAAQPAYDSDSLIAWCGRKQDAGIEMPDLCNVPAVTVALRKPASP